LSGFSPDVDGSSRGEALLFIQAGYYVPPALSVQAKQSDEESDGLEQVTDPSTDSSDTSAEQILSDEGLSTSTGNVSTEQGTPTAAADSFDVKGAIDGIVDSIKKLFERILGIEAKLEQQQQEIDELRAKIEAIQPQ
jgi:lipopolysaccharide export system protein LptA